MSRMLSLFPKVELPAEVAACRGGRDLLPLFPKGGLLAKVATCRGGLPLFPKGGLPAEVAAWRFPLVPDVVALPEG